MTPGQTLLAVILGGPVVISTPFVLAYLLVQKPADEIAAARRAAEAAERAARQRPARKELAR